MMASKADTCPAETHVIELAELRQIIFEMQEESEEQARGPDLLRAVRGVELGSFDAHRFVTRFVFARR